MKTTENLLHINKQSYIFVYTKSKPHRLDWDTHQIILKTENASFTNGGPRLRVALCRWITKVTGAQIIFYSEFHHIIDAAFT